MKCPFKMQLIVRKLQIKLSNQCIYIEIDRTITVYNRGRDVPFVTHYCSDDVKVTRKMNKSLFTCSLFNPYQHFC